MNGFLSTGIPTLDTLLGGRGVPVGSCVLVRGAPGTGKTTLVLQIAKHHLEQVAKHNLEERTKKNLEDRKERTFSVLWLSVEQPPEEAIGQILLSLWPGKYVDYEDFDTQHEFFTAEDFADWIEPYSQRSFRKFLEYLASGGLPVERPDLIVVDSVDALAHAAAVHWDEAREREAILSLLDSLQTWRRGGDTKPTAIVTAEAAGLFGSGGSQSYLADVVIELSHEPLTYETLKEELLTCAVIKGRGLPTQRRSSCYEFVTCEGLKFFPTYASPGLVSLFYENNPQGGEIDDFTNVDIPRQFPRVVVQGFSRSELQRMYAIARYQERIPSRHPLYLSSVDEHWVGVLAQRGLLQPIRPPDLELYSMEHPEGWDDPEDWDDLKKTPIIPELSRTKGKYYRDQKSKAYLAVPYMANVGMLVYRRDLLKEIGKEPPETWEEMEQICEELREKERPYKVLLETETYDTLMATALELCWGHGAFWHTTPGEGDRLEVEFEQGCGRDDLVRAMQRLYDWVHKKGLVPRRSSVDPRVHPELDWAFARHWYSTWVDVLTFRKPDRDLLVRPERQNDFGICRLPVAESYRDKHGNEAPHHSAWGEWYLAIQRGSENVELGIELINNLMTSRKIRERALSGAGLPTVKQFYKSWGDRICIGTDMSFNDLRKMFFADAKSRTDFVSYRKVASVFSGALNAVVSNPNANVSRLVKRAIDELGQE